MTTRCSPQIRDDHRGEPLSRRGPSEDLGASPRAQGVRTSKRRVLRLLRAADLLGAHSRARRPS